MVDVAYELFWGLQSIFFFINNDYHSIIQTFFNISGHSGILLIVYYRTGHTKQQSELVLGPL